MSTSKRAKEARQKAQAAAKKQRQLEAQGFSKVAKKRKKDFTDYVPKNEAYRPDEKQYSSVKTSGSPAECARPNSKQYTGDFIRGIGTMHKSNAIPVVDPEFMKDLARMRRN